MFAVKQKPPSDITDTKGLVKYRTLVPAVSSVYGKVELVVDCGVNVPARLLRLCKIEPIREELFLRAAAAWTCWNGRAYC